jgi:hypothetical protein
MARPYTGPVTSWRMYCNQCRLKWARFGPTQPCKCPYCGSVDCVAIRVKKAAS